MLHHHLSTHTDCSCTFFLHEIQFYLRGFLLKKARIFCFLRGSAGRRKVSVSETGFVRTCPPQHLNLNRKTPSDTSLPVELLVSGLILWAHVKITFRQRLHSQGACCCYSPPRHSHTLHIQIPSVCQLSELRKRRLDVVTCRWLLLSWHTVRGRKTGLFVF